LEPVAFGLKFAGSLGGGSFFKGDLSSQLHAAGVDATATPPNSPAGMSLLILNKDSEKNLVLSLDFVNGRTGDVEANPACPRSR
jgi:hypothetical protein